MKKFTKILLCLILCVFGVGLVACGDDGDDGNKAFTYPMGDSHVVSGNGGLAVKKGNYIYFVNGFKKAADSEQEGEYLHGGLLLAKLDDNGELVVDDNNSIKYENYIQISSTLSGFEASDLCIFGDYLYFTTVCQKEDAETEEWNKDCVTFNRVKLDQSSDVEEIYESSSKNSTVKFKFYSNGSSVGLVVFEKDDNKLVHVSVGGENVEIEDVQDVYFAEDLNNVIFVEKTDSETLPYVVKKINGATGSVSEFLSFASSVSTKFVENGKVYILEGDALVKYDASTAAMLDDCVLDNFSTYKSVVMAPNGDALIAISTEDTGMIFEVIENGVPVKYCIDTETAEANVIGFANGRLIYRDKNNKIKALSYGENSLAIETIATLTDANTTYFDIDGSFMYFFKKVGNNEYLHRLVIDNGAQVEELVGVALVEDVLDAE